MEYNNKQMNNNVRELFPSLWANEEELARATSSCLSRVFIRMFAALIVTAATAFAVANSPAMLELIFGNTVVLIVLIVVELALVIGVSAGVNKVSPIVANLLFFAYAIVNGLTLSVVFLVYEIGLVYRAFAVAALMFAGMAVYGTITRRNLVSIGSYCLMGLFGLIIAGVVNIFFRSDMLDAILCYAGVLIFVGLTAYDTQMIKKSLQDANYDSHEIAIKRISVIGALRLYLDFINLFLRIIRILGRKR